MFVTVVNLCALIAVVGSIYFFVVVGGDFFFFFKSRSVGYYSDFERRSPYILARSKLETRIPS